MACCMVCDGPVWIKDRRQVDLVDLAAFGRPARRVWHKRRWRALPRGSGAGLFTESSPYPAEPPPGVVRPYLGGDPVVADDLIAFERAGCGGTGGGA